MLFGVISSGLNTTSQASFMRDYRPMTVAQPWRADAVDRAQFLVAAVHQTTVVSMPPDALPSAWRTVTRIEEVAKDDALATYAANIDKSLMAGFAMTADNIKDATAEFQTMRRLANLAAGKAHKGPGLEDMEAVMSRFRILAGIGMANAAMSRKYTYTNEALAAMDATLAVLHDEAQAAYAVCDNGLFLEIRKYMTEFAKMMNDLAYRLPGLVLVNFLGGVHPLVAAYVIYNDAKRHRDLEQRNKVDANGRFDPLVVGVAPVLQ
jgi:hypothetical protein